MGVVRTLRRVFKGKQKRKHSHKALSSWESMYNALHNHPLTQAKIVNEQLLQSTHESLHKIEHTIAELERRIEIIEKTPKPKEIKIKEPTQKMQKLVADPRFSEQERSIVDQIKQQNETDAESIAKIFKISRSNASLKLNKLYNWGYLEKRLEEKTVFYRIKE